jgi:hypothetical protein
MIKSRKIRIGAKKMHTKLLYRNSIEINRHEGSIADVDSIVTCLLKAGITEPKKSVARQ